MQIGKATGIQIAFFVFAVMLLTVPAFTLLGRHLRLTPEWTSLVMRVGQLSVLGIIVFALERFRAGLVSSMLLPVPPERRWEWASVTAVTSCAPFALLGAVMLVHWIQGGPLAVEQRFPTTTIHVVDEGRAFSTRGLVVMFAAIAIAPVVEEIVFRGFLFRAWAERWGWIPSMILTSLVFGVYHSNFLNAFLASILLICLYRRTGTLVAPIVAHAVSNAVVWYPLLGQFFFPSPERAAGDITTWWFHLTMLTFYVMALPVYVFMARNAHDPSTLP